MKIRVTGFKNFVNRVLKFLLFIRILFANPNMGGGYPPKFFDCFVRKNKKRVVLINIGNKPQVNMLEKFNKKRQENK
ncbi:MAG: hypothetical protein ACK5L3_01840 [Oscillospiraceae bacterium]